MFRIQNIGELSRAERSARKRADEQFASKLARELARLSDRSHVFPKVGGDPQPRLKRVSRFIVEPVTKRSRLWRGRGGKAHAFPALDIPEHTLALTVLSERAYLRSLWRVSEAWPIRAERLNLWRR